MTLPELYEALERHDWFYAQSDDQSVYLAGHAQWNELARNARTLGPEADRLLADFSYYKWGPAYDHEPKPPKPKLEDYV